MSPVDPFTYPPPLFQSAQRPCHSISLPLSPKQLTFSLNAIYFAVQDSLHQLVHKTAMVSPVSVVVANLVMEVIEFLASFPLHPTFGNNS